VKGYTGAGGFRLQQGPGWSVHDGGIRETPRRPGPGCSWGRRKGACLAGARAQQLKHSAHEESQGGFRHKMVKGRGKGPSKEHELFHPRQCFQEPVFPWSSVIGSQDPRRTAGWLTSFLGRSRHKDPRIARLAVLDGRVGMGMLALALTPSCAVLFLAQDRGPSVHQRETF
jgi:hypothetical protein